VQALSQQEGDGSPVLYPPFFAGKGKPRSSLSALISLDLQNMGSNILIVRPSYCRVREHAGVGEEM
jgi:hypothetical protein